MNKHQQFIKDTLIRLEELSTCARLSVGAILVDDTRIVSTGYNGSVAGMEHCDAYFTRTGKPDNFLEGHRDFSRKYEIHAEQNTIAFAARNGISTEGKHLYCSYTPCNDCAKLIIQSGIAKVLYLREYDREPEGLNLLKEAGIEVTKLN